MTYQGPSSVRRELERDKSLSGHGRVWLIDEASISKVPYLSGAYEAPPCVEEEHKRLMELLKDRGIPNVERNDPKLSVILESNRNSIVGVRDSDFLYAMAFGNMLEAQQVLPCESPRNLGAGHYAFVKDPELGLCQIGHIKGKTVGEGAVIPLLHGGFVEQSDFVKGETIDIRAALKLARIREEEEEVAHLSKLLRPIGSAIVIDEVATGNLAVQRLVAPSVVLSSKDSREGFVSLLEEHNKKLKGGVEIESFVVIPWEHIQIIGSEGQDWIRGVLRLSDLSEIQIAAARPQTVQLANAMPVLREPLFKTFEPFWD